jgi:hypothetical protein
MSLVRPYFVALPPTRTSRLWCDRFNWRVRCFVVGPFGHVAFALRVTSQRIRRMASAGTPRCLDAYLLGTARPIFAAWPVRSRTTRPRLHGFTFQHRCSFTRCRALKGPPRSLPRCTVQLLWWFVVIVVALVASVRQTRCFKPSRILSWGSKPVSRPRLHSTLIISLPMWSTGERWRLTPLGSLVVSSFGCSVVRIPFNAGRMHYFWNGWPKTSIAFIIVAASTFDIPPLANWPTR